MKMDEKFKYLTEQLVSIKNHMNEIKADLRYHIKRTDMLEGFMKGLIKFLLVLVTALLVIGINRVYASNSFSADFEAFTKKVPCKVITYSAKRSIANNRKVGGAINSYHLYGRARDISASCLSHLSLGKLARSHFKGVIVYKSHVHIDNRDKPYFKIKK